MAAYVHCNFHSCILRMQVDVSILLPEKERMEDVEQEKRERLSEKTKNIRPCICCMDLQATTLRICEPPKLSVMQMSIRSWWLCQAYITAPIRT